MPAFRKTIYTDVETLTPLFFIGFNWNTIFSRASVFLTHEPHCTGSFLNIENGSKR